MCSRRTFYIILSSVVVASAHYASQSSTLFSNDTLKLTSSSVLHIDQPIHLEAPQTVLLLSAKNGIIFSAAGKITANGDGLEVIIDADSDRNGKGDVSCSTGEPCIFISGENSSAKIYGANDGDHKIVISNQGAFSAIYKYLYSVNDLISAIKTINSKIAPSHGWGFALAREMDVTGLSIEPIRGPFNVSQGKEEGFYGAFDGMGHKIKGLSLQRPFEENVGLFGLTFNARIERIGLVDATVSGWAGVGALVGYLGAGSSVIECFSTGTVVGNYQVGGLIGEAYRANIEDAYSHAAATGTRFIGGLVGFIGLSSSIVNSYAAGIITGKELSGQLAGRNRFGVIENSHYYGSGKGVGSCLQGNCLLLKSSEPSTTPFQYWDIEKKWLFSHAKLPELLAFRPDPIQRDRLEKSNSISDPSLSDDARNRKHRSLILRNANGQIVGHTHSENDVLPPKKLLINRSIRYLH